MRVRAISLIAVLWGLGVGVSACESTPQADKDACAVATDVVAQFEALPQSASPEDRKAILDKGKTELAKALRDVQSVAIRQLATTTIDQQNTGAELDEKVWIELAEACKIRGRS